MNDFNKRISNLSPEKRALLEQCLLKKSSSRSEINRISRRETSGPCVLSFGQERLWLYDQIEPDIPNIIHCPLRIKGKLNRVALEKALNTIVDRHEILRATFSSETGEPLQIVNSNPLIEMSVIDIRECPEENLEAEMHSIIHGETLHMFDLSKDLMLRAVLLRLSDSEHIFILIMHHIASDGWSLGVFFQELVALYASFSEGKPSPLEEIPVQYTDYAYWQRQWMKGEVLEKQLSYWKGQLVDMPPALTLPADRPRPTVRSLKGSSLGIMLPKMLVDQLRSLITREGVTMFTLMMAAFRTLLYRYTGQEDICVGTFSANRNRVELENMIGFFVNTLIMRTSLSGSPSFIELLHREHESALGAFANQDIPFEKILEVLNPDRTMSHTPLFQVSLAFQDMPKESFELPNMNIELMDSETSVSLYDLSLIIEELKESIYLSFTYRTDIFDASTLERWAYNFQTLLEGIAANPEQPVGTMPLLSEAETRRVVVEWNKTGADYPEDVCIHGLIEMQVQQTPDAVAVVFEEQQLTYRELNSMANQLANFLRKQGVGPEVLVGISIERSLMMVIGLLGILKAGGAYVPLDPAYPEERLKLIMEDSGISVLLTEEHIKSELPLPKVKQLLLDTDWNNIALESNENPASGAKPDNAAYVIYTSGSTGRPKGVVVEHRSLMNFIRAAISEYGIRQSDRVLQFASINFDASAEEIYPCLVSGATLVLRTDQMLNSNSDFLNICGKWELTVLSLPTVYWHELAMSLEVETLRIPDPVRLVIIGGEQALPERLKQWYRHVGSQVRLLNSYGPTETTVVATMCDLINTGPGSEEILKVPIGRPMPNVQTYILDAYLNPLPIGVSGELHIGGNGLARGYLNRPEMTAQKFISDPFCKKPGARLYKTGDLARWLPDGNIEFLGRIDHQLKIRGYRIEPGEIEEVLFQHNALREVTVIAREDSPGDKRLIAYVILNEGTEIKANELRSFLKKKVPDYLIPSAFIILEDFPLTPNGKIDLNAMPIPDPVRSDLKDTDVAPRTPTEEVLLNIWSEILGLKQVGIHDNFFNLGGHSLLATRVISRIRLVLGVDVPLRILFESPTVEELAERLLQSMDDRETLEKRATLFLRVAELSDAEVNTMLTEGIRQRDYKSNG